MILVGNPIIPPLPMQLIALSRAEIPKDLRSAAWTLDGPGPGCDTYIIFRDFTFCSEPPQTRIKTTLNTLVLTLRGSFPRF